MNVPDIIIAVDGYSSTGKSSFAKALSARLGLLYLDSGAMYRGVTLHAMEKGLVREDGSIDCEALRASLGGLELHFERSAGKSLLYSGARCIEEQIRTLEVSAHVSPVSAIPFVREWVDERLHSFAREGRVVMDGRDIGTTVFPDAQLKIFMTADEKVRAQRRFDELCAKGQAPVLEDVLENLRERDYIDSHREVSPLRQAADAFVLDNSAMSMEEELAWATGLIQGRFSLLEAPTC